MRRTCSKAETLLAESVDRFRELTTIAGPAYRTATSMETTQRQIPFRGGMNQFPNWQQCLPMYEKELATFRRRIVQLSSGATIDESKPAEPLPQIEFTLKPGAGEAFTVEKGASLFLGSNAAIVGSCAGTCRHEGNPHRPERRWNAALRSRATGADPCGLCELTDRRRVLCSTLKLNSGTWCF